MKYAYNSALSLMLILVLIGGISCEYGNNDSSGDNSTPTVIGSGNIIQETRSVSGAMGVNLRGVANLTIEQGTPENLILQIDDNLMAVIITNVQDEILVIRSDPEVTIEPSQTMEAQLRIDSIDTISLTGVGSITVPTLTTAQLELTLSGVGDIDIINLDAQTLNVGTSGLGDLSITGQVQDQIVELNSLGEYEAENLVSTAADVEIMNSGSATVQVSATLNVNIIGSGSVYYHGSPVVTRTGGGTGNVVQLSP